MLSLSPKEREMHNAIKVEKFLENVGKENVRKEAMSEGIFEGKEEIEKIKGEE